MAASHEFSLDDIERIEPEAPAPAAPVVVIHYRGSWLSPLLLFPSVIVCLAAVGIYYRAQLADWTGLTPREARTPEERAITDRVPESRATGPADMPRLVISVNPAPDASAPGPVVPELSASASRPEGFPELALARPLPEISLRPPKSKAPDAGPIGFDLPDEPDSDPEARDVLPGGPAVPAADAMAAPPAESDPAVATNRALDEIRNQAQRAHAERAAIEEFKKHGLEDERRLLLQKKREKLAQVRRDAEINRGDFIKTLERLLRRAGRAGNDIHRFMQEEIAELDPTVSEPISQSIDRMPYQADIAGRIIDLRRKGVPEALILKFVWRNEIKNLPARKGPRDEAEAMVFAARHVVRAAAVAARRSGGARPASGTAGRAVGDQARTSQ